MSCSQRGLQTGFQETDFHQTGFIEDDFSQGGFGYGDHSYKAEWARQLVLARLAEFYQTRPDKDPMRDEITIPPSEKITPEHLPQLREVPTRAAEADEYRVCIIGAGVAGLFTAMIIDYLNGKANLGFTYDIFEAASETRFGGRLYTHRFSHALHDYYDIGAMRFPKIPIMERTFDLFKELRFVEQSEPSENSEGPLPSPVKLIPYYLKSNNCPSYHNDIHYPTDPGDWIRDPYGVSSNKPDEKIPCKFLMRGSSGPKLAMQAAIEPFKIELRNDAKASKHAADCNEVEDDNDAKQPRRKGWDMLMKADRYSVRQYLARSPDDKEEGLPPGPGYNNRTIGWLETFTSGTLNFDEAFSEVVLGDLDFNYFSDKQDVEWNCIEGGTQQIADAMRRQIKGKIKFNNRVTMIRHDSELPGDRDVEVRVKYGEAEYLKQYVAVFNSTTLASMQRMDLTGAFLNYGTKVAIRAIRYGTSCKIGIKFKEAWWVKDFGIKGGSSSTDLPLRTCVYPSYNINDQGEAVLLCSYTWGQDAQRLAALIKEHSPEAEDELKEILFRDLTLLHCKQENRKKNQAAYDELYQKIKESYITHHSYDWGDDKYMSGAFAHFGPGQFSKMYPDLITPSAGGKLFIIGEAASKHHAWVVGALESAVRGVYQMLERYKGPKKEVVERAMTILEDKKNSPYGPLPYDEDREIVGHQELIAQIREKAKLGERPVPTEVAAVCPDCGGKHWEDEVPA